MKDHEKLEAIGAYLVQYPPSGFTDRYSAAGWAHIARAVLSAASIFGRAPHGEDHEAGYWREKYEIAQRQARAWQNSYDGLAARMLAHGEDHE
jgi:hypothetical protein